MQTRILAHRYRLLSQLGQGGMGSVWLAEHMELGTRVAVKLMDPAVAASTEGLSRFKREAQAAASLDSPSVVRVFDFGVDANTPYIAMELLKGENLAQRLKRTGRVDFLTLSAIYMQVGKAITKAHGLGIVHRDLKPDNIFLVPDDDGDVAKVIDFGIAKRSSLDPGQLTEVETQTGTLLGTPFYMSPEQVSGSKVVDYRTDIWSLGIIAYECITGQRPYGSNSIGGLVLEICSGEAILPSQLAPVPAGFDDWFARCSAKVPADRYPSAREAAVALWRLGNASFSTGIAVSRIASANDAAATFRTEVVSPDFPSPSDHVGVVALPLPCPKPMRNRTRVAAVIGLGASLVLAGTVATMVARTHPEPARQSAAGQATAAPSIATEQDPLQRVGVVQEPVLEFVTLATATATRVDASAAQPTVVVEPVRERPGTSTARSRVPHPSVPPVKEPDVSASAPVTAAPIEQPSFPSPTAPDEPAKSRNPFATRE